MLILIIGILVRGSLTSSGLLCFVVYTPLCWVRKIEKFALFHIFADLMILATVTVVAYYAFVKLNDNNGELGPDIVPINTSNFLSFIGRRYQLMLRNGCICFRRNRINYPCDGYMFKA
jgi:amino acid permease